MDLKTNIRFNKNEKHRFNESNRDRSFSPEITQGIMYNQRALASLNVISQHTFRVATPSPRENFFTPPPPAAALFFFPFLLFFILLPISTPSASCPPGPFRTPFSVSMSPKYHTEFPLRFFLEIGQKIIQKQLILEEKNRSAFSLQYDTLSINIVSMECD